MPRITFIDHEGVARVVEAEVGYSLMEAARNADIPGIVAECGGVCACATCHVFVDENYLSRFDEPDDREEPMLEFVEDKQENSRLSCQLKVTAELDGMIVHTPASQG